MSKNKTINPNDITRYTPSIDEGLSFDQVNERVSNGLANVTIDKSNSILKIILKNFLTFFNIMYVVIFILLFISKVPISNYLFVVIVSLNLFIGTYQEIRAKLMIDKLNLVSQAKVKVIRDGKEFEIDRKELVLDDIMVLSAGQEVTADSILVSGEVEVNESQLTGESVSIRKNIGEMIYSGSIVVSGNCYVKVEKVGKENQIEKLSAEAKVLNKPHSEIFKSLNMLLRVVAFVIVPLGVIMVYMTYTSLDINIQTGLVYTSFEKFQISIEKTSGALLGMIPSGLYLLTSMTLALGVVKLSKHQTLVHDIYCIEMLARVDVLCLDKTGTITDGSMSVTRYVEYQKRSEYVVEDIIGSMNTSLNEHNFTAKALENYFGFSKKYKPIDICPFNSENKYSAVTFEEKGTFVIGAPEFVLKNGFSRIEDVVNEYANQGLRVLALAHSPNPLKNGKLQKTPKLVALILIEDHIREDVVDTINFFKENGVEIKIISGDNPLTVSEVARRVGVENAEEAVSLDGLTDDEVYDLATKCTVFGRVKPNQKQIIVKALKDAKKTVAMTGDGVNDILAMKEADCSVAMASGCEAVKNVAQLVLLDSNFNAMPRIVAEGRRVINNIQQTSMLFLVKTLFVMGLSLLFVSGFFKTFGATGAINSFPISPSQLTLVEVFAIGIPAFFLALQPNYHKISGSFLTNVIRRALPGALAVVLEVVLTYLLSSMIGLNSFEVSTIVIFVVTATCIMILYMACRPFNFKKIILFGLMSFMCTFIIFASTTGKTYFGINFQEQFKLYDIVKEPDLKPFEEPLTELPGGEMIYVSTDTEGIDLYSYTIKLPTNYEEIYNSETGFIVNINNGILNGELEFTNSIKLDFNKPLYIPEVGWVEYADAKPMQDGIVTVYFKNLYDWHNIYVYMSYEIETEITDATALLLAVALSETSYIIIMVFNYFVNLFIEQKHKIKRKKNQKLKYLPYTEEEWDYEIKD